MKEIEREEEMIEKKSTTSEGRKLNMDEKTWKIIGREKEEMHGLK